MTIKEDLRARLGQGLVGRLDLGPEEADKVVSDLDGFLGWLAKDGPLVMTPRRVHFSSERTFFPT